MKILKIVVTLSLLFSAGIFSVESAAESANDYSFKLEKLKKNPSAKISLHSGWTIISLPDGDNHVIWFFSPEEHAAHPAMIKKTISVKGGGVETVITTLCDAGKKTCDDLIKQFQTFNGDYQ
jgi:hypothetical protein